MYVVSLVASLCFAWTGAWGLFRVSYLLAWAIILGAFLFVASGNHGVHGSPAYMIAWGLIYLLPFLAVGAVLTGLAAWGLGALGSRHRALNDEAS